MPSSAVKIGSYKFFCFFILDADSSIKIPSSADADMIDFQINLSDLHPHLSKRNSELLVRTSKLLS